MIDNVIKIFDYIYIISNSKKRENQDFKENEEELNNLIVIETGEDINYFWDEYSYLFNKETLYFCEIDNGSMYFYEPFPKLTLHGKNKYLSFKVNQLKYLIENNGELDLENLEKDLNINNSIALKSLVEYFINQKILIANNEKWLKKYVDGSYGFNFEHIKINMNYFSENNIIDRESSNSVINYGTINGSVNQLNNSSMNYNESQTVDLILSKMKLLEQEIDDKQIVEELKEKCKSKNIDKLKELLLSLSGSVVAQGIIMMLGWN